LITKVRFGLDKSFGIEFKDVMVKPGKPIQLTYYGTGSFNMPIKIYWKNKLMPKALKVKH